MKLMISEPTDERQRRGDPNATRQDSRSYRRLLSGIQVDDTCMLRAASALNQPKCDWAAQREPTAEVGGLYI